MSHDPFYKELESDLTLIADGEPVDYVNHPPHYNTGEIEVIDYIVDKLTDEGFEGYCIGNALKYLSRYRHKGGIQDIEKATWYLNKFVERSKQK